MNTIERVRPLVPTHHFSVGPDGAVSHGPDVDETLARRVHYACRIASQLEAMLGLGELLRLRTTGTVEVDAAVSWGLAGECLVKAHLGTGPPPLPMLPPAPVDGEPHDAARQQAAYLAAQLDATLAETHTGTGAVWSAVFRHDLTPLRLAGSLPPSQVTALGSRVLGVVNGLALPDLGSIILDLAHGTLVVAPVGRHALCFFVEQHDAPTVRAAVDRARTLLDGLDLASATPAAPKPPETQAPVEAEVDWAEEEWLEPEFAFPVGARFAGMAPKPPRAGRRRGRRRG